MTPSLNPARDCTWKSGVPDQKTACEILGILAGLRPAAGIPVGKNGQPDQLAAWLAHNELGPLAQSRFRTVWPELAARLQLDTYTVAAQNTVHWRNLELIDTQFARRRVTAVLLKGAALATTVYGSPEQRSMVDVDLWLQQQDIRPACQIMSDEGFTNREKSERPLALQALSEGEIQFYSDDRPPTLVELHLSPYPGWVLRRTAAIDKEALWARKETLAGWRSFYQLAPEDAVIHTAVHLVVNHQFGLASLRSLIDIALTIQARPVDWQVVLERARQWHVATALWIALYFVEVLIGLPGLDKILQALQPAAWRRRQLVRLVSPESLLAGADLRNGRVRYLFLLLLVDRPQDAGSLVFRTLWPEGEYLDARYGGTVDHWQHLRRVVLHGEV